MFEDSDLMPVFVVVALGILALAQSFFRWMRQKPVDQIIEVEPVKAKYPPPDQPTSQPIARPQTTPSQRKRSWSEKAARRLMRKHHRQRVAFNRRIRSSR